MRRYLAPVTAALAGVMVFSPLAAPSASASHSPHTAAAHTSAVESVTSAFVTKDRDHRQNPSSSSGSGSRDHRDPASHSGPHPHSPSQPSPAHIPPGGFHPPGAGGGGDTAGGGSTGHGGTTGSAEEGGSTGDGGAPPKSEAGAGAGTEAGTGGSGGIGSGDNSGTSSGSDGSSDSTRRTTGPQLANNPENPDGKGRIGDKEDPSGRREHVPRAVLVIATAVALMLARSLWLTLRNRRARRP